MVGYLLMYSAQLENITKLKPMGGCNAGDFTYLFKVKCCSCQEISQKECKFCHKIGTITMIRGEGRPLRMEDSTQGSLVPLMLFECNGYKPVDYVFGPGWSAKSVEGTWFENINFSTGEFTDYDEEGECSVVISNLRAEFVEF